MLVMWSWYSLINVLVDSSMRVRCSYFRLLRVRCSYCRLLIRSMVKSVIDDNIDDDWWWRCWIGVNDEISIIKLHLGYNLLVDLVLYHLLMYREKVNIRCEPPENCSTPTYSFSWLNQRPLKGRGRMFISMQVASPERFFNFAF